MAALLGGLLAACSSGTTEQALAAYADRALPEAGAPVDDALADLGADLFRTRCSACHTLGQGERVGPDLAGVTRRRDYAWIRGMILAPDSMTRADPDAQALRERYQVQMVTPGDFGNGHAAALLEFLRRADGGGG